MELLHFIMQSFLEGNQPHWFYGVLRIYSFILTGLLITSWFSSKVNTVLRGPILLDISLARSLCWQKTLKRTEYNGHIERHTYVFSIHFCTSSKYPKAAIISIVIGPVYIRVGIAKPASN